MNPKQSCASLELILTTGRSLKQGIAMEKSKLGESYELEAGGIELDVNDANSIGASKGDILNVQSDFGQLYLPCRLSRNQHPGIAFIPMGPWANSLIDPQTHGSGMPSYKNIKIQISLAPNKEKSTIKEFLTQLRNIKWAGAD